jgi:hypothetical protein
MYLALSRKGSGDAEYPNSRFWIVALERGKYTAASLLILICQQPYRITSLKAKVSFSFPLSSHFHSIRFNALKL